MPQAEFLTASDGVKLAYYSFMSGKFSSILLFLHGGGAYSGGGYAVFASNLSKNHNIGVVLMDIRGHGNSGGMRGHAPSKELCWDDIRKMGLVLKGKYGNISLFIGGHSSGGGMVLNYSSWDKQTPADGYIFISPQLGYKSGTEKRTDREKFAKVNLPAFIINGMSGGALLGSFKAVSFNYPKEVLAANPLFITSITVNMANAMTPYDPAGEFRRINRPYGLFIGGNDELFEPSKVLDYFDLSTESIKKSSVKRIIPGANHLSILLSCEKDAAEMITGLPKAPLKNP